MKVTKIFKKHIFLDNEERERISRLFLQYDKVKIRLLSTVSGDEDRCKIEIIVK